MANSVDCAALNMELRCTWGLDVNGLTYETVGEMGTVHHLYAIVVFSSDNDEGSVKYVGKTRQSLHSRFLGYRNPGNSQATNRKVNCLIRLALQNGYKVQSFSFQDNTPLQWNGINLNIAAGLEDALIDTWRPEWNFLPNNQIPCSDNISLLSTSADESVIPTGTMRFTWKLGKTYYNSGFLNPGVKVDQYFGQVGEIVRLTAKNGEVYESAIDRTANVNKTARLKFSGIVPYLSKNYHQDDILNIEIVDINELKEI